MIVPLIPLFLTASLNLTEREIGVNNYWKYGPEVIYEVRYECERCLWYEKDRPEATPFNETMELSCRPKSISSLSCQFHSEREKKIQLENGDKSFESKIFELNFASDGLKKIIISTGMHPVILNAVKATVAQLNVAADIFNIRQDQFIIWENFFTGTCRTHYLLSVEKSVADTDVNKKSYKNLIVMEKGPRKDEIVKIRRTRNVEECINRLDYFAANLDYMLTTPRTFNTKLISSKSLMTIRQSDFSSWTENTIMMKSKLTSTEVISTEKITLTLKDIVPATAPLTSFTEPTYPARIFIKKWLNNEISEEDSSSEEKSTLEDKTN